MMSCKTSVVVSELSIYYVRHLYNIYLYLYKIESLNFDTNVLIERKCEALHMTCLRIQHEVESDMG